jgi:carboxymethylenebutenolidase
VSAAPKAPLGSSRCDAHKQFEKQQTGGFRMAPHELEKLWEEHLAGEFNTKDVEATLATMTDDASVDHVPVHSGGCGKEALRAFYRDNFIPSWPDDTEQIPINRVIGDGQLVDEIRTRFTHSRPMEWFLPGVAPTHKAVDIDIIVVVQFRGDKITCERIYWDQATVLRQVGLLSA